MSQEKLGNTMNELDAAKAIVETLAELQKPQQERAIRFAMETLGILVVGVQSLPVAGPRVQATVSTLTNATDVSAESGKPITIKQFVEAKAPKSDQQFAAVVAYYYQFESRPEERRDSVDAALLADAARLSSRKRPSRHALNNARRSGYVDSAGHGDFKLNTVGENLVAVTLPSSENSIRAKKSRKARSKK